MSHVLQLARNSLICCKYVKLRPVNRNGCCLGYIRPREPTQTKTRAPTHTRDNNVGHGIHRPSVCNRSGGSPRPRSPRQQARTAKRQAEVAPEHLGVTLNVSNISSPTRSPWERPRGSARVHAPRSGSRCRPDVTLRKTEAISSSASPSFTCVRLCAREYLSLQPRED